LTNYPLIEHIAKKGKPMIISTGGAYLDQIADADTICLLHGAPSAFLHCVAMYPTKAESANLSAILTIMDRLQTCIIGYSCHFNGTLLAEMSYIFGARIIEKHFTLDHTSKGSDHALSLQPQGMKNLVRDLRRMRLAPGDGEKLRLQEEEKPLEKMEKVGYPNKTLKAGTMIDLSDITLKSPATKDGFRGNRLCELAGKSINQDCSTSVALTKDMLKE
jgi:N-acetylneuraminate synthase/sialic acid synthase